MAFGIDKGTTRTASSLSEINVTPLVDVMLVLLIIFMITAPMIQHGIDVSVPKTKHSPVIPQDRLIFTITKDKVIQPEGKGITQGQIGPDQIPETIESYFAKSKTPKDERSIYIRADASVPYEYLMVVIDQAKESGISAVGLITEPKKEEDGKAGKGK
ncbi:MAG: biopolymer transporter ExbD [Acidobacteriota bacterium]